MRVWRSLVAVLVLTVLLAGVPWAILRWGNWTIISMLLRDPHLLLEPDNGQFVLGVVTLVGVVAWVILAWSIVLEAIDAFRRRGSRRARTSRSRFLGFPRGLVRPLVTAAFALAAVGLGTNGGEAPVAAPVAVQAEVGVRGPAEVGIRAPGEVRVRSLGADVRGSGADIRGLGTDVRGQAEVEVRTPGEAGVPGPAREDVRFGGTASSVLADSRDSGRVNLTRPLGPAGGGNSTVKVGSLYVVGPGDSLWSIAERAYGNGEQWPMIAQANENLVHGTGDLIQVGWQLTIPEPGEIGRPGTVTVQEGQSLWQIAEQQTGDGNRWSELALANPGLVSDPNLIQPGWQLALPSSWGIEQVGTGSNTVTDSAGSEQTNPASTPADTAADTRTSDTNTPNSTTPIPSTPGNLTNPDTTPEPGTTPGYHPADDAGDTTTSGTTSHDPADNITTQSDPGINTSSSPGSPPDHTNTTSTTPTEPRTTTGITPDYHPADDAKDNDQTDTDPDTASPEPSTNSGTTPDYHPADDARDSTNPDDSADLGTSTSTETDPNFPDSTNANISPTSPDDPANLDATPNAVPGSTVSADQGGLPVPTSTDATDRTHTSTTPSGSPTANPTQAPLATDDDRLQGLSGFDVVGQALAVGTVLAGGMIMMVRRRRLNQLRARPIGRRIILPGEEARRLESAFGLAACPATSSSPDSGLARLTATLESPPSPPSVGLGTDSSASRTPIPYTSRHSTDDDPQLTPASNLNPTHLTDPADPPGTSSVGLWTDPSACRDPISYIPRHSMEAGALGAIITPPNRTNPPDRTNQTPAPTPRTADSAMVIRIGEDAHGDPVTLDISETRPLLVTGEAADLGRVMSGIAMSLAVDECTTDVELHVVTSGDLFDTFTAVESHRNYHSALTSLRQVAGERRQSLDGRVWADLRADPDFGEAWREVIYCFLECVNEAEVRELASQLDGPPIGVAVLVPTIKDDPGDIAIESSERAWAGGEPVRPFALEISASLTELLETSVDNRTTLAWWSSDQVDPPAALEPRPTATPKDSTTFNHPTLRLLGPILLEGACGEPPPRAERACMEYCGWLLEHPGTTATAMALGLMVAEGTRRSNMSRLRTWLGSDPDAHPYLPEAYSGRIWLDPAVSSDWQRLRLLIANGVEQTPVEQLVEALEMVRGAPLADASPGQWHWAEELRLDMVSVIRDIGAVATRKLLACGNVDQARWATTRALTAAPEDELLLCARVVTEHAAGNRLEVERLISWIGRNARNLGIDLLPQTVTTLQRVLSGKYPVPPQTAVRG